MTGVLINGDQDEARLEQRMQISITLKEGNIINIRSCPA